MLYKKFKGLWIKHGYTYTFLFNREHFKKVGMLGSLGTSMPTLEAHQLMNHMNREAQGEWAFWLEDDWKPQVPNWEVK